MVAKATLRYIRLSPRKVRQVIDLIRGKDVNFAEVTLLNINKRPAYYLLKVLKSAVANAEHNAGLKGMPLFVSKITADSGPTWKRYRSSPFGRAAIIRRRTCHIAIELDQKEKAIKKVKEKIEKRPKRRKYPANLRKSNQEN